MTLAPLAKLPKAAQDGLTATTAAGEGERSNRLWLVNSALLNKGYPPEVVYRIGISCPGIWLCCVAKRDEERAGAFLWEDILRAVAKQEADRETAALQKADWDSYNLKTTVTRQGVEVLFTPYNARLVIEQHPLIAKRLQMDGSTGEIIWEHRRGDGVLVDVGEVVREVCGWDQTPSNEWLKSPVLDVSEKSLVYPKADELRALRWDGEQRLDNWLVDHVADPSYLDDPIIKTLYRDMGRKILIGYVARLMEPGIKLDTVPVFIGAEGAYKNEMIIALAGSIDKTCSMDSFSDKDDLIVMAQAEIVELSETHALRSRRTTNEQLKGFITRRVDTYRHPYAARPVKVRRGFCIMAAANKGGIFTATQDGLRRFWPIHVKKIDIDWITANRTQLIAEAVTAFLAKEKFWYDENPAGLSTLHQGATQYDAIAEKVEQLVESQKGKGGLTFQQVREAIEEYSCPDHHLADALTKYGVTKQKHRAGDKRVWVWGVELWGKPRPQAAPTEAQQAAAAHGASTRVDPDDLDPLS
jgi:predicted P-loop ATPase